MASRAADSGEFLFQVTVLKVSPHNIGDNRTIKAMVMGKPPVIDLFKTVKMVQ
jgi:hypothetical protein